MRDTKSRLVNVPIKWKFGKLPTEILFNRSLTTHEKLLMGCLLWHGEQEVWPGIGRLAELMSCSPRHVMRAIRGLESKLRLVVTRAKGGVNTYDMQSLVTDSHGGSDTQSLVPVTASHPNDTLLNENKRTETIAPSGGPDSAPSPLPVKPKTGEPKNTELKSLVTDWYDTFLDIRKFKDSSGGGLIAGILGRALTLRGAAVLRWELTEYWRWLELKGVHGGDIRDFSKKENMLHDMYLERTKRRE